MKKGRILYCRGEAGGGLKIDNLGDTKVNDKRKKLLFFK